MGACAWVGVMSGGPGGGVLVFAVRVLAVAAHLEWTEDLVRVALPTGN